MSFISYPKTTSAILNVIMRAIAITSRSIIRDFGEIENLQNTTKVNKAFITESILKAEKIIITELEKSRPGYNFVINETNKRKNEKTPYKWIVNLIDGIENFIHGFPQFITSVTLLKNDEIIASAIYEALKDEMFYAKKGFGAFMNQRRLKVSKRNLVSESLFSIENLSNYSSKYINLLYTNIKNIRQTGSLSLDLAYIASGRLDGMYAHNISIEKISAGILILNESGGYLTNEAGTIIKYTNKTTNILASNLHIHKTFLNIINKKS